MEYSSSVPPGFRFHPTEEELVGYYLNRKINSLKIDLDVIVEIDLYKIEPWDIQDRCKYGYEEQNEWYFFSHKDKKYPTGTRTNRATAAGFWKATGRDKAVLSNNRMIGMRKTLVFYKGRAPNGQKTDWIMHEYRLQTSQQAPPQEEGWVVCRAFKKPVPNQNQRFAGSSSHAHYNTRDYNDSYKSPTYTQMPSTSNTMHMVYPNQATPISQSPFNSEQDFLNPSYNYTPNHLTEFPQQDSPSLSTNDGPDHLQNSSLIGNRFCEDERRANLEGSCVDWKNLDELLMEPSSLTQTNYDQLKAQNHLFTYLPDI